MIEFFPLRVDVVNVSANKYRKKIAKMIIALFNSVSSRKE